VKNGPVLAVSGSGSTVQMPAVAELMRTDQMPKPDELRGCTIDALQLLNE